MQGRSFGFVSGLGAATADTLYAIIAGLGITVVASFMTAEQAWIRLVGGGILCYLGIRGLLAKSTQKAATTKSSGLWWNYLSILLLTITNPMTILSFMAVFAALGVANSSHTSGSACLTVVGVFIGSALWWFILSGIVSLVHKRLNPGVVLWINRLSGAIITALGILGIGSSGLLG